MRSFRAPSFSNSRPTIEELYSSEDEEAEENSSTKKRATPAPNKPGSTKTKFPSTTTTNNTYSNPSSSSQYRTVIEEPDSDEEGEYEQRRRGNSTKKSTANNEEVPIHRKSSGSAAAYPSAMSTRNRGKSLFGGFSSFGNDLMDDMMNRMNQVMNHSRLFEDDPFDMGDDLFDRHRIVDQHDRMMRSSFNSSSNNGKSVYYSSMMSTTSSNGVTETKRAVKDSRDGTERMSVQRRIGDKTVTVEKVSDRSGREQTTKKLENVREEEEGNFEQEWQKVSGQLPAWHIDSKIGRSKRSNRLAIEEGHGRRR